MNTSHTTSYNLVLLLLIQISVEDPIWAPPEDIHTLCPYTSFCNEHSNQSFPFSEDYIPCCSSCSCSDQCGLYDNCCHSSMDRYRTQEKFKMICRSQEASKSLYPNFNYYKMINKCLDKEESDNIINCEEYTTNPLQSFYPVFSPSTGFTYITPQCAKCNKITDGVKWQKVVRCDRKPESDYFDEIETLINGTDFNPNCMMYFIPPEGFGQKVAKCEPHVVRTCNTIQLAETRDETWDRCSEFNATFRYPYHGEIVTYGNVYCWMCNTNKENRKKLNTCAIKNPELDIRNPMYGVHLIILLDMKNKYVQDKKQMDNQCRPSEVFLRSFERSCRLRRCPFGQILFEGQCGYYSKEWYGGPFSVMFKLTPATADVIPRTFFDDMPTSLLGNRLAPWLRRGVLQDWFVLPVIHTSENRTSVRQLIARITYHNYSVDPLYLQKSINQTLHETWFLKYGEIEFQLNVALNEVTNYQALVPHNFNLSKIQTDGGVLVSSHGLFYAAKTYPIHEQDLLFPLYPFNLEEFSSGIFLTKLFFCQQVDLLPDEFTFSFVTVYFKVTNKTMYDADFRTVQIETGTEAAYSTEKIWTIRICIEEFPGEIRNHGSTCQKITGFSHIHIGTFVVFLISIPFPVVNLFALWSSSDIT